MYIDFTISNRPCVYDATMSISFGTGKDPLTLRSKQLQCTFDAAFDLKDGSKCIRSIESAFINFTNFSTFA